MLNHIELNKACSVVNVWWSLAVIRDNKFMAPEAIHQKIVSNQKAISEFKERKIQDNISANREAEESEIRDAAD